MKSMLCSSGNNSKQQQLNYIGIPPGFKDSQCTPELYYVIPARWIWNCKLSDTTK